MSFVGTRPEAVKYVEKYKPEYLATLLLPAGITSEASIRYKDEAQLLDVADDVDRVYIYQYYFNIKIWDQSLDYITLLKRVYLIVIIVLDLERIILIN